MCIRDVWPVDDGPQARRLARVTSECLTLSVLHGDRFLSVTSHAQFLRCITVSPRAECLTNMYLLTAKRDRQGRQAKESLNGIKGLNAG